MLYIKQEQLTATPAQFSYLTKYIVVASGHCCVDKMKDEYAHLCSFLNQY